MIIESLIRRLRFIIEFIMELSCVVILMFFIVFRESLGLENLFNGFVNELWEGGNDEIKFGSLMPLLTKIHPSLGLKALLIILVISNCVYLAIIV